MGLDESRWPLLRFFEGRWKLLPGGSLQASTEEFSEWCEEQSKNLMFEIKTGKQEIEDLKAVIAEESAIIETETQAHREAIAGHT